VLSLAQSRTGFLGRAIGYFKKHWQSQWHTCLLGCLLAGLCGVAIGGCSHPQPSVAAPKPPEVLASLPLTKEVTDYEEFPGWTDAMKTVEIRARVTGYLSKVLFAEGYDVKEGDVLFVIDQRPYQATLDQAKANVVLAKAHLARLDADFGRAKVLLPQKAISQEDFDKAAGDRAEADALLNVAVAAQDLAQLNLDFTEVKSPISGRISRQMIDPGNLVQADVTPLTTIVSLDPMYAYFDVDEHTVLRVRQLIREGKIKSAREVESPLALGLADEEGFPHEGTIHFVDNPKEVLAPGLFARIRVPIGVAHAAILVPERALASDQGQKFLYVLNDQNEVQYRPVKVGALSGGMRVIEEGLAPDEKVVVNGLQRVRPGIKVEPKLIDAQNASATDAVATKPEAAPPHRPSS
jgi:RND family efflux transporter MFP subunit